MEMGMACTSLRIVWPDFKAARRGGASHATLETINLEKQACFRAGKQASVIWQDVLLKVVK